MRWSLENRVGEQKLYQPSEAEARLNKMQTFSSYRKENTTLHHYEHQLVNAV
jgi:hypothetical protein